jgi:hypothetical protein
MGRPQVLRRAARERYARRHVAQPQHIGHRRWWSGRTKLESSSRVPPSGGRSMTISMRESGMPTRGDPLARQGCDTAELSSSRGHHLSRWSSRIPHVERRTGADAATTPRRPFSPARPTYGWLSALNSHLGEWPRKGLFCVDKGRNVCVGCAVQGGRRPITK